MKCQEDKITIVRKKSILKEEIKEEEKLLKKPIYA